MPRATYLTWPVLWTLFYLAPISETEAQYLGLYVDNVSYNRGAAISCRPGATLLFQCEYLGADQSVFHPFPPQLCSSTITTCRGANLPTSSPPPPWPSGKLRSNSTISDNLGTSRYYVCQYTTSSSYVTILFTDSAVYPANVSCVVTGAPSTATTVSTPPPTTPSTTPPTTPPMTPPTTPPMTPPTTPPMTPPTTPPTTTHPTTTITMKPTSAGITVKYSPTSGRTSAATQGEGYEGLTDLNPLIYTVVGVFLLGVLAIVIIITCWIRARRMFNSRLVNLRTTTSPFDYLDYISEGDLTPITTTEFIISMQQQRPPTYNQSQELEVLTSVANGNPPLPARNGTSRSTDVEQIPPTTTSTSTSTTHTRHPNDSVSPEEAEVIESRINTINRRLIRASTGRGRSNRRSSGAQTNTDTVALLNDRDDSPPNLFDEVHTPSQGHTPSQPEGTQMSQLL